MKRYDDRVDGLHGRPITFDIRVPDGEGSFPLVIFAHGFKGFKDWGHFNLMADWFAGQNFVFCKFNFSHNGIPALGGQELTDLDAFAANNFSIELDDLQILTDHLISRQQLYQIDTANISLIGHSRVGGLVMLRATEDARISKVVSWAGVTDLGRYWMGDLLDNWLRDGVQYVRNSRTGQMLPMDIQFYHDYIRHKERLDLPARMHQLHQPLLHIHGTADEAVPVSWAQELKLRHPRTHLHIMDGADHVFGSRHPWTEKTFARGVQEVLETTLAFLKME
ncbi:MAG TPA: prolyl oligopeptidase family serine peptidase [Chitinophagales bacterium]|nr:prolyl oligopeptidase family serine peptidase [Chitinophagales bacterium]